MTFWWRWRWRRPRGRRRAVTVVRVRTLTVGGIQRYWCPWPGQSFAPQLPDLAFLVSFAILGKHSFGVFLTPRLLPVRILDIGGDPEVLAAAAERQTLGGLERSVTVHRCLASGLHQEAAVCEERIVTDGLGAVGDELEGSAADQRPATHPKHPIQDRPIGGHRQEESSGGQHRHCAVSHRCAQQFDDLVGKRGGCDARVGVGEGSRVLGIGMRSAGACIRSGILLLAGGGGGGARLTGVVRGLVGVDVGVGVGVGIVAAGGRILCWATNCCESVALRFGEVSEREHPRRSSRRKAWREGVGHMPATRCGVCRNGR
mmetsp:Transcript_22524/g.56510  ORF Transcript_22524/g.56510 Transcript_22524/m.56510 type:complete len:316 (+) Transcript_22524:497-1444(+)